MSSTSWIVIADKRTVARLENSRLKDETYPICSRILSSSSLPPVELIIERVSTASEWDIVPSMFVVPSQWVIAGEKNEKQRSKKIVKRSCASSIGRVVINIAEGWLTSNFKRDLIVEIWPLSFSSAISSREMPGGMLSSFMYSWWIQLLINTERDFVCRTSWGASIVDLHTKTCEPQSEKNFWSTHSHERCSTHRPFTSSVLPVSYITGNISYVFEHVCDYRNKTL